MSAPGPLLRKAVSLLQAKGEISRDSLLAELWTLVQPGVAHRARQEQVVYARSQREKRRGHPRRILPSPELSTERVIELGARSIVRGHIHKWINAGILNVEEIDGRTVYRLGRIPSRL